MMWANRVLAADADRRDTLMNSAPPGDIIHLFCVAASNAQVRLDAQDAANQVARLENTRTHEALMVYYQCC